MQFNLSQFDIAILVIECAFHLRWVKAGSGYGQALLRLLTTESSWCILKA